MPNKHDEYRRAMGLVSKLVDLVLDGSAVERFHTWPTIKSNTVGAHSFGVAWWTALIYEMQPSVNVLLYALSHDLAEYHTGDTPANVKWEHPDLAAELQKVESLELKRQSAGVLPRAVTEEEKTVVSVADSLDMLAFAVQETRLGNRRMNVVSLRVLQSLHEKLPKLLPFSKRLNETAVLLTEILEARWRQAN